MPSNKGKKARDAQWPSLTFLNSPLFMPTPILSPDVAVDNPVTAKPIAVDELTNTVWVSPQFRSSGGRLLRRRCKQKSQQVHLGAGSRLRNQNTSEHFTKTQFRPLPFLEPINGVNGSETRLITDGLEGVGNKRRKCRKKLRKENSNIICEAVENISQMVKVNGTEGNDPWLSTDKAHIPCDSLVYSAEDVSHQHSHYICDREGHGAKRDQSVATNCVNEIKFPVTNLSHQVCTPELQNCEIPVEHCGNSNRISLHNRPTAWTNVKDDIENVSPSISAKPEEYLSFSSHAANCQDVWDSAHDQEMGLLDHMFMQSPSRSYGLQVILAADTPECDYGLSVRQRQLKYGLENKTGKAVFESVI